MPRTSAGPSARTTAPRLGRISTTPMPARTINASRIGITPTPSLSASGWTISRWPGRSRPWTISLSRRSTTAWRRKPCPLPCTSSFDRDMEQHHAGCTSRDGKVATQGELATRPRVARLRISTKMTTIDPCERRTGPCGQSVESR